MADVRANDDVVTEFLLNTCRKRHWLSSYEVFLALFECAELATQRESPDDGENDMIPVPTGSVAEFYIQPSLSCVGDTDIMFHYTDELAIPEGTAPPTQLPEEFDSCVIVCEIVDYEFPGYVYLVLSYFLTECIDDGTYNVIECRSIYKRMDSPLVNAEEKHGPAIVDRWSGTTQSFSSRRVAGISFSRDNVCCVRCLSWPLQAADWPIRQRHYGWPDSATVDHIASNGCDVVQVAHRLCRSDKWMLRAQWRLSFSRAEVVLLNSWMPVQQIIYHMLRVFVKVERLTDSTENFDAATLSNYHIKTLMLWACELKSRKWWIDDLNVIRLSVELLHNLGIWLTDARCPHYFIHNCNLLDHPYNCYSEIASRFMSETKSSLAEWFINNYIRACTQLCPDYVLRSCDDLSNSSELQKAVSSLTDWRMNEALFGSTSFLQAVQCHITSFISHHSLTLRLRLCWIRVLVMTDPRFAAYITALMFLHVAHKITVDPLKDELLDILATTCLQSNDVRRCLNARHSSVLSLSQAAKLMKVVANNSSNTVQLIETEVSKAYLYRALRYKDSGSDSIYSLANVYLAVLYYTTGHYQTAIDHCTLVTKRSQDRSQCTSHVVQGELLPKIDGDIDSALGLAVFYQYVRTAALNQQQTQHVGVFTTKLFAHYLHIRCLSVMKFCQLTEKSLPVEIQRYQKCFYESQKIFTTDVLVLTFLSLAKFMYPTKGRRQMKAETESGHTTRWTLHQLNTAELVELLQQSAVEHLTASRQFEAQEFSSVGLGGIVTTDFEALYAYKCGEYQRCLHLSTCNVRTLIDDEGGASGVFSYPEFIQLMDDEIVSLIGLVMTVSPSFRLRDVETFGGRVSQLSLSMYHMTQCQMKLHHPVTSLARTLDYIEAARQYLIVKVSTLDQLLLKLTARKILLYISR